MEGARTIAASGTHNEDGPDLGPNYRTLLEQIPAIVYIWSVPGGLEGMTEEYVSPQIEAVLGFAADEWMADPSLWVERLHPDDRDEVMDETARSVEAGESFKLEYRMIARDGRVVWLHDVASMVARDNHGRATRYQGVQLDITARKEAEHAERRIHAQFRSIDRERRDLVRRLVGAQEDERRRISEGIHDDSMQRLFRVLHRLEAVTRERPELEHVEGFPHLTEEIRELIARLRHLAFELHPRILDEQGLGAALDSLLERTSSLHADTHFDLDYRLIDEPSAERSVALYRAAQEALSNAMRHSEASNVRILLHDRDGGVNMRVEDDGRGFPVDVVKASASHLGLVSMRERAEILGGWLQVDSEPGLGTRLDYWLPHAVAADTEEPEGDPSVVHVVDPQELSGAASSEETAASLEALSPRENEVAELLALGHTNIEIGTILHLSVRTIEHHRSRVFRKLGVQSRAGVVQALAERSGDRPNV